MSDTPRTDAKLSEIYENHWKQQPEDICLLPPSFAKELERDLANAYRDVDALRNLFEMNPRALYSRCEKAERELAATRQALRIAKEEIEFDAAHAVVSSTGEKRVVSQALDVINAVLAQVRDE